MHTVFLSHTSTDRDRVTHLVQALGRDEHIRIWNDQAHLYQQDNWPRSIGHAIADRRVFLLVWSKAAAQSRYVEFEWRTALALGKSFIPCLVDDTPLPMALGTSRAHQATDIEGIRDAIYSANPGGTNQQTVILAALEHITAGEVSTVVEQASTLYKAHSPSVGTGTKPTVSDGSTALAHRDTKGAQKSFLDRWQSRTNFLANLVTIVVPLAGMVATFTYTYGPDLSSKLGLSLFVDEAEVSEQILSGSVQDKATNQPLDRVDVTLLEFGQVVTTNPSGYFEFHVRAPKQDLVSVSARRKGYAPSEIHKQILGDRKVTILLKRTPS